MTLATRLRMAFAGPPPPVFTDPRVTPGTRFAEAAVLVAITDRPEPGLILTLRRADLRRHAGQVAFPGGRVDPGDADAVGAALREAQEEIALDPGAVEVVGTFGRYRTGTGFEIVPVIGVVPPDLPLVPHEAEVAAVFEPPLAFLTDVANHARRDYVLNGRSGYYYEMIWGEWRIWGVTAGMIVALAERLRAII